MLPADAPLVSINDHLVEPPDLWSSRVPSSSLETVPHVVSGDRWQIGSQQLPIRLLSVLAADGETRPAATYGEMLPAVWSAPARLAAMDRDRVEMQVLLPHVVGFAGERLAALGDTERWARATAIYNEFVLGEFCAHAPARLTAAALLPLGDVTASEREIARVAHAGARAVSLPHDFAAVGLAPLHDPQWQRLFDALVDHDLTVMVHVGSAAGPPSVVGRTDPAALLLGASLEVHRSAIDLLTSGLLADRPTLRVALLEGGAAWLATLVERAEFFTERRPEIWRHRRAMADIAREQLWVSFIDDPLGVALARQGQLGVDKLLWQSDFPHADSFWPDSRARLGEALRDVPDTEAQAIAGGNARRLLRFD